MVMNQAITSSSWLTFFNEHPKEAVLIIKHIQSKLDCFVEIQELQEEVTAALHSAVIYMGVSSDQYDQICFKKTNIEQKGEGLYWADELFDAIHQYQASKLKLIDDNSSDEQYNLFIDFLCYNMEEKCSIFQSELQSELINELDSVKNDWEQNGLENNPFDERTEKYLNDVWLDIKEYLSEQLDQGGDICIDEFKKEVRSFQEKVIKYQSNKAKHNNYFQEECLQNIIECYKLFTAKDLFRYFLLFAAYDSASTIKTIIDDIISLSLRKNDSDDDNRKSVSIAVGIIFHPDNIKLYKPKALRALDKEEDKDIVRYAKLLEEEKNVILQGAPGVGKTFIAQKILEYYKNGDSSHTKFVTFHQSYDYEDFVEGIKVSTDNGTIRYELKDGVFKEICKEASRRTDESFLIVIDEINRGNIAKIFGELISLIEKDKREDGKHPLRGTLPSGDEFSVPGNLFILGTMNTTDRSVGRVDYALRRRFAFETIPAVSEKISDGKGRELFNVIKDYILKNKVDPEIYNVDDIMIGHSYFMVDDTGLISQWKYKIKPLLEEYINDGLIRYDERLKWYESIDNNIEGIINNLQSVTSKKGK